MSKLIFTKNKIKLLKSNFSEEDLILSDWLASCPIDLIKLLIERLDKQITNDAITDWFINKFNTKYRTKKIDTEMRILTSTPCRNCISIFIECIQQAINVIILRSIHEC